MDSRRKKKKKALKQLNKKLALEKGYMGLPTGKKLMRFLKETGRFIKFITLIRKKHHIGFQSSINLIKTNPDIYYLIGSFCATWSSSNFFGSQSPSFIKYDEMTEKFMDEFNKFRPTC